LYITDHHDIKYKTGVCKDPSLESDVPPEITKQKTKKKEKKKMI
jgi:hypothetical protein